MASHSVFYKKQTDWMKSKWIRRMHPISRLCWDFLLAHVKVRGRAGVCDLPDAEDFTREYWLDGHEEHFHAMIRAAEADGAISLATRGNGDNALLTVTNWKHYQSDPTVAERQSRFRSKGKSGSDPVDQEKDQEAAGNGDNALHNDYNGDNALHAREERRGEENRGEETSPDSNRGNLSPSRASRKRGVGEKPPEGTGEPPGGDSASEPGAFDATSPEGMIDAMTRRMGTERKSPPRRRAPAGYQRLGHDKLKDLAREGDDAALAEITRRARASAEGVA